jgi:hypothetical protein
MKSIIVGVAGYLFIRWNVDMIEASPPAIYNLLMVLITGVTIGLYAISSLFNYLTEPHYVHPVRRDRRAQIGRNLPRAQALQSHHPAPRKRVIGVMTLKCAGNH